VASDKAIPVLIDRDKLVFKFFHKGCLYPELK